MRRPPVATPATADRTSGGSVHNLQCTRCSRLEHGVTGLDTTVAAPTLIIAIMGHVVACRLVERALTGK